MSPIRIVLIGQPGMLRDIIKGVLDEDPALEFVGETPTVEGLPHGAEPDVVIIHPLAADVPTAVYCVPPGARVPAVLGVEQGGARGVVVVNDLSRAGLVAAIHAAAALREYQGAS